MRNIGPQLIIKICSALLLVLFTGQCANKTLMSEHVFNVTSFDYGNLGSSEFQNEIDRLQKFVLKTSGTPDATRARLQLAFLYSHYRNPSPDYARALDHLEKYVLSEPQGGKQDYVQNWLRMLKEISATASANDDLKGKLEQMKKDAARIEKENNEIKEKLEQLKHLDIELEQKRKLVK